MILFVITVPHTCCLPYNVEGNKRFIGPLKLMGAWGHREDASWLRLKRQSPLITRSLIEAVVKAGSASDSDSES